MLSPQRCGGEGAARKAHLCRYVWALNSGIAGKHTYVDFLILKSYASELERSLKMVVPGDLRAGTLVIND